MKLRLTKNRTVCDFCKPYIIAELASNHNGDMRLARRLILQAKKAGADCVKFQSWSKDTIFSKKVYKQNYFLKDDYRKRKDYTLEKIVDKFSISFRQLLAMKKYADKLGIDCIASPFAKKEVDFLVEELKVNFIKIASMDLNNYSFLEYIGKKGLPILLSTGLSSLPEIDRAIKTIESTGNRKIAILHCVSNYPPKDEEVNLNNIETLRKLHPYPVGFSDHTLGFSIALAAAAKGACIIEKHFTLDKTLFGWDHKISSDPKELEIICRESERINKSLGSHRVICEETDKKKNAFRRSIVSARKINKGELIREEDIDFKRPGYGMTPGNKNLVIGKRAKKIIPYDKALKWSDLS